MSRKKQRQARKNRNKEQQAKRRAAAKARQQIAHKTEQAKQRKRPAARSKRSSMLWMIALALGAFATATSRPSCPQPFLWSLEDADQLTEFEEASTSAADHTLIAPVDANASTSAQPTAGVHPYEEATELTSWQREIFEAPDDGDTAQADDRATTQLDDDVAAQPGASASLSTTDSAVQFTASGDLTRLQWLDAAQRSHAPTTTTEAGAETEATEEIPAAEATEIPGADETKTSTSDHTQERTAVAPIALPQQTLLTPAWQGAKVKLTLPASSTLAARSLPAPFSPSFSVSPGQNQADTRITTDASGISTIHIGKIVDTTAATDKLSPTTHTTRDDVATTLGAQSFAQLRRVLASHTDSSHPVLSAQIVEKIQPFAPTTSVLASSPAIGNGTTPLRAQPTTTHTTRYDVATTLGAQSFAQLRRMLPSHPDSSHPVLSAQIVEKIQPFTPTTSVLASPGAAKEDEASESDAATVDLSKQASSTASDGSGAPDEAIGSGSEAKTGASDGTEVEVGTGATEEIPAAEAGTGARDGAEAGTGAEAKTGASDGAEVEDEAVAGTETEATEEIPAAEAGTGARDGAEAGTGAEAKTGASDGAEAGTGAEAKTGASDGSSGSTHHDARARPYSTDGSRATMFRGAKNPPEPATATETALTIAGATGLGALVRHTFNKFKKTEAGITEIFDPKSAEFKRILRGYAINGWKAQGFELKDEIEPNQTLKMVRRGKHSSEDVTLTITTGDKDKPTRFDMETKASGEAGLMALLEAASVHLTHAATANKDDQQYTHTVTGDLSFQIAIYLLVNEISGKYKSQAGKFNLAFADKATIDRLIANGMNPLAYSGGESAKANKALAEANRCHAEIVKSDAYQQLLVALQPDHDDKEDKTATSESSSWMSKTRSSLTAAYRYFCPKDNKFKAYTPSADERKELASILKTKEVSPEEGKKLYEQVFNSRAEVDTNLTPNQLYDIRKFFAKSAPNPAPSTVMRKGGSGGELRFEWLKDEVQEFINTNIKFFQDQFRGKGGFSIENSEHLRMALRFQVKKQQAENQKETPPTSVQEIKTADYPMLDKIIDESFIDPNKKAGHSKTASPRPSM